MTTPNAQYPQTPWRQRLHTVIFESDTPGGKVFDITLLLGIIASVIVVMIDSVTSIHLRYGSILAIEEREQEAELWSEALVGDGVDAAR